MLTRDKAIEVANTLAPMDQVAFCAAFIHAMDEDARNRLCDMLSVQEKATFLDRLRNKAYAGK